MPTGPVERFVRTLQQAEQSRDIEPLVELFTEDAELDKPAGPEPERGRDGARRFWESYLRAFGRIRSEFARIVESDTLAVLEWTSDGVLPDGRPLQYDGVSILELADGRVKRFRTYYDSAAFVQPRIADEAAGSKVG
jgi:ketosteroid isomerase-like protein